MRRWTGACGAAGPRRRNEQHKARSRKREEGVPSPGGTQGYSWGAQKRYSIGTQGRERGAPMVRKALEGAQGSSYPSAHLCSTDVHPRMHTHTNEHTYTRTHAERAHRPARMHTQTGPCASTQTHTHEDTHTHTHTHTHTNTCKRTQTQMRTLSSRETCNSVQ
jgi:hypothetical protein